MAFPRRAFLVGLLGVLALAAPAAWAHRGRHRHPHGPRRRRIRRRVRRRRIRRRVGWRRVGERRVWIVPIGLAVGWELLLDDRLVVVREVREQRIVVEHRDGSTEELEVTREDTEANTRDLEGSAYEVEVETDG